MNCLSRSGSTGAGLEEPAALQHVNAVDLLRNAVRGFSRPRVHYRGALTMAYELVSAEDPAIRIGSAMVVLVVAGQEQHVDPSAELLMECTSKPTRVDQVLTPSVRPERDSLFQILPLQVGTGALAHSGATPHRAASPVGPRDKC